MKKLLSIAILLFALCSVGYGQNQNPPTNHLYLKGTKGKPTFVAQSIGAICPDYSAKQLWKSQSKTAVNWILETDTNIVNLYFPKAFVGPQGPPGKDGKDGIGIPGPQGPVGLTGPAGRDGVCPSCPPTSGGSAIFPFIILQPTGGDDTQLWKSKIAEAKTTNKAIYPFGTSRISSDLIVDLDHFDFTIIANGARILITASGPMTAIKRRQPVNNSEALNVGTFAKWRITGLTIIGNQNQNGIDCGPQYNANISGNYFDGLKRPIWAKFALWSKFLDNMFVNCYDGCIVDVGDWPDATNFNSQSNSCEVTGRYYGNSAVLAAVREAIPDYKELLHKQFSKEAGVSGERIYDVYSEIQKITSANRVTSGGVAFGFYGVSGAWLHDFIVEGVSAGAAVDFDGLGSPVVKDGTIERGHIEMVNGFTAAAINIRILGGTVTVDKIFGQYPAMFMDASSTSGIGYVQVSNVPWWVPKSGKYFKTSNISLDFTYNEAFRGINSSMWEGTAASLCGGASCGYHKYTYKDIPR